MSANCCKSCSSGSGGGKASTTTKATATTKATTTAIPTCYKSKNKCDIQDSDRYGSRCAGWKSSGYCDPVKYKQYHTFMETHCCGTCFC
jgi:hypothetical protein